MYVAGAALHGPADDRVDQANVDRILRARSRFRTSSVGGIGFHRERRQIQIGRVRDQTTERGANVSDWRDHQVDRVPARKAKLVHSLEVAGVCNRDAEPVALEPVRNRSEALQHANRDCRRGVGLELDRRQIDKRETVSLRQPGGRAGAVGRCRRVAVASRESKRHVRQAPGG